MRIYTTLVLSGFCFCASGFAQAASEVSVLVGAKAWYTDFSVEQTTKSSGFKFSLSSDSPKLMYGPAITVRYRNFQIGISQATVDFNLHYDYSDIIARDTGDYAYTRDETDINVAMSLNSNFSVVLGNKNLDNKLNITSQKTVFFDGITPTQYYPDETYSYVVKGYYIGASAYTRPNPAGVVLFGNLALSKLKDQDNGDKYTGTHIDAGVGYIPKQIPAFMSISFRQQSYDFSNADYDGTESYSGLNVTLNYRF